jgi:hypothetical protein
MADSWADLACVVRVNLCDRGVIGLYGVGSLGLWGLHNEIDHIVAEYGPKVCLVVNSHCFSPL